MSLQLSLSVYSQVHITSLIQVTRDHVSKVDKDPRPRLTISVHTHHELPPLFQSLDMPTTIDTPSSISKFDKAVAGGLPRTTPP
jgi:hypothetical protein